MSKRKAEIGERVQFRRTGGPWLDGWVRGFDRLWVGRKQVHAYAVDDGEKDNPDPWSNGATVWRLCLACDLRKPQEEE